MSASKRMPATSVILECCCYMCYTSQKAPLFLTLMSFSQPFSIRSTYSRALLDVFHHYEQWIEHSAAFHCHVLSVPKFPRITHRLVFASPQMHYYNEATVAVFHHHHLPAPCVVLDESSTEIY